MKRHPPAPKDLRPDTRKWWRKVVRDFDFDDHHLKLLRLACVALDRASQAREILARDGLTVSGRQGKKPHPAIAIERDSMITFARLLRELDLDFDGEGAVDRSSPPALLSNRG